MRGIDVVFVHDLRVQTIIGLNPWERKETQQLILHLDLLPHSADDLLKAAQKDHVSRPQNYRTVARAVQEFVEQSRYKTLEALTLDVVQLCLFRCRVPRVRVRVDKPSAILFAECACIEMIRSRSDFDRPADLVVSASPCSHTAYIALGSNRGDRAGFIEKALRALDAAEHTSVEETAFLYESSAAYYTNQPAFLNTCCRVTTQLSPEELLTFCKSIEGVDRTPTFPNGPREIDLDILFYDALVMNKTESPALCIPHPRIPEREFVLQPLMDLVPTLEHPSRHRTVAQLLRLFRQGASDDPHYRPLDRVSPLGSNLLRWGHRTYLMGVLNITPDSFSDGGQLFHEGSNQIELEAAYEKALLETLQHMIDSGADILDVGGQSTRPGAEIVSEEEERRRVLLVIRWMRRYLHEKGYSDRCFISVDTFRASVAYEALRAGACIVNDVSGGTMDPDMAPLIGNGHLPSQSPNDRIQTNFLYVCMHMRGTPETMSHLTCYHEPDLGKEDVVGGVVKELEPRLRKLLNYRVRRWNVVLDPGIGFAKNALQNIELIRRLKDLNSVEDFVVFNETTSPIVPTYRLLTGFPILAGPSRKSFLGKLTGQQNPQYRDWATAAACSACIAGGADILRIHNVEAMRDVVAIGDAVWRPRAKTASSLSKN